MRKTMKMNLKKLLSVMLVLAMVLQAFLPSAFTSHAAEVEARTEVAVANDVKYVYYTDISEYRAEEKTYPKEEGYVFAGWWTGVTEEDLDTNATALAEDVTTDGAWAKYVPEDVMTVKAQVSKKVATALADEANPQSVKLRLLTGVDNREKYTEIGFNVTVNGTTKSHKVENKFYDTLTVNEDSNSTTVYPNDVFHQAASEFVAYVIGGFNTVDLINDTELRVTPYWKTLDGTVVEGTTRERLLVSDERAVDTDQSEQFAEDSYVYTSTESSTTAYKYFKGGSDTVYLKGQYTPSSDKNVKFGIAIRNGGETRQVLFSNVGVLVTNGDIATSGLVEGDANAYENVTGADGVYVWTGRKTSSVTSSGIKNLINATSAKTVIWAIENNVLYCSIEGETVLRLPMKKLCAKWQDGRYYQLGVAANGGASESSMTYALSEEDLAFGKSAYGSDKLIAEATENRILSNMVYEPIHGSYKASSTNTDTAVVFGNASQGAQVMSAKLQLPTSSSTVDSFNGFYIRSGNVSAQILICYQNGSPILVANSAYPNDYGRVQTWFASAGVTEFYKNGVCELTAAVKDDTLYIFVNDTLAGSVELYKLLSKSGSNDLYIEGKSSVQLGVVTRKPDVGTISFRDFSVKTGEEADNAIATLAVNDDHEWEIFTDGGDKLFTANNMANHDGYNHTATSSTTDGQNNAIYGVATKMPQKVTATYSFGEKTNDKTEGAVTSGNGIIVRGNSNAYAYIYGINGYGQVFRRATGFNWRNGDDNSLIKTWPISGQAYNDDGTYDITAVFKDGWVYVKYNDQVMFKDQIPEWKESHSVRIGLYTCAQASVPTYYTNIKFEAGADVDVEPSQIVTNLSNMTYNKESQSFTPGNVSGIAYGLGNALTGSQVMSTTIQLPAAGTTVNSYNGIYLSSGSRNAQIVFCYAAGTPMLVRNNITNTWYRITDLFTSAGITEIYKDRKCELTVAVQDDILYIFINGTLAGSVDVYKLLTYYGGANGYIEGTSSVALGFCASDPKNGQVSFCDYSLQAGQEADETIETLLTDVTNLHEWEIFANGNVIISSNNMTFDGYQHSATTTTSGGQNSHIYGVGTTMPQQVTATYSFGNTESTVTSGNGIIVRGNSNAYTYIYGINGYGQVFRRAKGFTWQNADTDATNIKTKTFEGQAFNADGTYNITAVVKDGWVYVKYNDQVMFKDQIPEWREGHAVILGLYTRTQASVPTYYTNVNFEAGAEVKVPSTENAIEEGMNISILGDSISTYAGVSNDVAADTSNSTIKNNAVYYPNSHSSALAQNETYWGRIIEKYGMNLLVNNSASGSLVMEDRDDTKPSGINRCTQLHDNTGDNAGTNPDIIAVYMGTNDLTQSKTVGDLTEDTYAAVKDGEGYITPTTFTEGYIIMMDKIKEQYGTADVFCFTLLPSDYNTDTPLNQYNARIRTIAAHYGFTVVDIAAGSGITRANNGTYMDGSHPHANGHALLADTFEEALMLKYATFKTF